MYYRIINTFGPEKYGHHFADDIFEQVFFNKIAVFDSNNIEIRTQGSNWPISIGLGNGSPPNKRKALTWTNGDLVQSMPVIVIPFQKSKLFYLMFLEKRGPRKHEPDDRCELQSECNDPIYNEALRTNGKVINPVYFDVLVQKRRNSITNALELRLSCINPSIWVHKW